MLIDANLSADDDRAPDMVLDFIVVVGGFFLPIPTKGGSDTAGARIKLVFPLEGGKVDVDLLIVVTDVVVVVDPAVIVTGSGTITLTL